MLLCYDINTLSFAVTAQSGSGAAFLTDSSNLDDGRSGQGTVLRWTDGTQNTSSFVEVTVTVASTLDATAKLGAIGLCNVVGSSPTQLVNLRTVIASVEQRLVTGERDELNAWVIKGSSNNSFTIRLYNDNGSITPPILPAQEIFWGEVVSGRLIALCTSVAGTGPSSDLQDQTSFQRSSGNQLYALMRKGWGQNSQQLGLFTQAEAKGGTASPLPDGAGGTIDIKRLRGILSRSRKFAVCDTPGTGTSIGGIVYDADFMQSNWMLARMTSAGQIQNTQRKYFVWNPVFQEAT